MSNRMNLYMSNHLELCYVEVPPLQPIPMPIGNSIRMNESKKVIPSFFAAFKLKKQGLFSWKNTLQIGRPHVDDFSDL